MKKLKFLLLPIMVLLAITFTQSSCEGTKIVFTARYDSVMISRVEVTKANVLSLYDNIRVSPDKSFEAHKPAYLIIDSALTKLWADEQARKKNDAIVAQSKTALDFFREFYREHEKYNNMPATALVSYRKYMNDIFNTWLRTERTLNK